jgi:hypothetical protein
MTSIKYAEIPLYGTRPANVIDKNDNGAPSTKGGIPMIDLNTESLITLHEAAEILHLSYRTIYRWATKGIKGVNLETLSCGRNLRTSKEALSRFTYQLACIKASRLRKEELPSPIARRNKNVERELWLKHGIR